MPGLYSDPDTGQLISTHSALKTFRRCPKQAEFKFHHRLKPKLVKKPLSKGKWMHDLLEAYHKGDDWQAVHKRLSSKFNELFDEEQEFYGNLPDECYYLMVGYIWHYKNDPWKIIDTEFVVETEFPDGTLYRGRVDMLIENSLGLWVVDHKNQARLPGIRHHLLDGQSALYIWACLRNRIPVQGFIWNYLLTKPFSTPQLVGISQGKPRLSTRKADFEYTSYMRKVKEYRNEGLKITQDILDTAERLKAQQYNPNNPIQTSSYFRRDVMEKNSGMLRRVALENYVTSQRMHKYDFSDPDRVERVVERSCEFSCDYVDVCGLELIGGNTRPIIKQNFRVGDPMDYYYDKQDVGRRSDGN